MIAVAVAAAVAVAVAAAIARCFECRVRGFDGGAVW